jgi:hypothetical protein
MSFLHYLLVQIRDFLYFHLKSDWLQNVDIGGLDLTRLFHIWGEQHLGENWDKIQMGWPARQSH